MYVNTDEINAAFYKTVKQEVEKWSEDGRDDIDGFTSVSRIEGMIALVEELKRDGGEKMNELVFDCHEAAIYAAMILLMYGHYVVMLSREEQLWIVNYKYSDTCNRNDVVFMSREDFEEKYCEVSDG